MSWTGEGVLRSVAWGEVLHQHGCAFAGLSLAYGALHWLHIFRNRFKPSHIAKLITASRTFMHLYQPLMDSITPVGGS